MHEITMQDIHGYLETKESDEVIGHCLDGNRCLAHNTLTWKYGLQDEDVQAICSYAFVKGEQVNFPRDVEQAVDTFDFLKPVDAPVTKAEFITALGSRDEEGGK